MDELLKAIALILGWSNQQEAADLLLEKANPVAQRIFNKGHATALAQETPKLETEKAARTKAEKDLVAAQTTITTLQGDKPDLGKMQKQHETDMETLETAQSEAMKTLKVGHRKALLGKDRAVLRSKLVAQKVPEALAEILVQDLTLDDRLTHDENGASTVFQAGTKIPISVGAGKDAMDVLATEYMKKVPPGTLGVDVDEGSEASGHSAEGGGGGEGKAKGSKFDKIRTDTKAIVDNKAATSLSKKRAEKFGGTVPAR